MSAKLIFYHFTTRIAVLSFLWLCVSSYDPNPLQDFCVGVDDSSKAVFVNGKVCKDPKTVTADDFHFSGLNKPGRIEAKYLGSKVTPIFVDQMPGLNTLGISMVRIDYALKGLNPPHEHPRASEILVVLEGSLYAGFITSNPNYSKDKSQVFAKILHPGDVFVFPQGLIHFQYNVGNTTAVAIASLNSQSPGVVHLGKAVFGSVPPVDVETVAKGFQMDEKLVKHLQTLNWDSNA